MGFVYMIEFTVTRIRSLAKAEHIIENEIWGLHVCLKVELYK